MSSIENRLRERAVHELRDDAREKGLGGASEMRKEELVRALAADHRPQDLGPRLRSWVRDRSLGIFFFSVFLATWIGQLFVEWQVFVNEQQEHGTTALFWSADFWETFGQSTLENWQSEFLQLAAFTIAAAYLVFKGSSESPDGDERLEAKLDALLQQQGIDPKQIEAQLPLKHQKTR